MPTAFNFDQFTDETEASPALPDVRYASYRYITQQSAEPPIGFLTVTDDRAYRMGHYGWDIAEDISRIQDYDWPTATSGMPIGALRIRRGEQNLLRWTGDAWQTITPTLRADWAQVPPDADRYADPNTLPITPIECCAHHDANRVGAHNLIMLCTECGEHYRYGDAFSPHSCERCARIVRQRQAERERLIRSREERVHGYSYVPSLNFLRARGRPGHAAQTFFGWELEVPTDDKYELASAIHDGVGQQENVLFCKIDGSVNGLEIVSHPMTFNYFSSTFDVDKFMADGADLIAYRSSELTPDDIEQGNMPVGYGLHIHVSRAGFDGESHALRWLLLVYSNEHAVQTLARREQSSWAGFSDADECAEKARGARWGDRYVAVNATNPNTFEMRFFRSTWKADELRCAMQFASASVEYTRRLPDVKATGTALTFRAFTRWLRSRPQYATLLATIQNEGI